MRADEIVSVAGAGRRVSGVVDGSAWRAVDLRAWVRAFGCVRGQLGNGVSAVIAVVRIVGVEAAWVVGELAAGGGDGDAWTRQLFSTRTKFSASVPVGNSS